MMDSLRRQGYTVLLARNDWEYVYHIHRQIPDMVKVIIGDPRATPESPPYTNYIKRHDLPDGFPAWKVSSKPNGVVWSSWLSWAQHTAPPERKVFRDRC